MEIATALFYILIGIAAMAFGIYIYYILLPLWYGIFGALLGVGIGQIMFSPQTAGNHLITWVLAIVFSIVFFLFSYALEPYRRFLIGGLLGVNLGIFTAASFGLGSFFAILLAVVFGVFFSLLTIVIFDSLIILGSSILGAALAIDGVFLLTGLAAFNRYSYETVAIIVWITLTVVGIVWQIKSVRKFVEHSSQYTNVKLSV